MDNIFSYEVIAQAIGLLASAVVVGSFAHKRDNHLKIWVAVGNIIFALHFFMLGAYTGMLINIINVFRATFSIKFHKSNKMMCFFMISYLIAGVTIFTSYIDLFPVFSSLLGTYSMFKLSGIKMRLMSLLASSSWLVYATVYQSIGGMITEVSNIILNSSTIFRLRRDNKKHEQNT